MNNLIDPTYRSQSNIIGDSIDVNLQNNLIAFNYQANATLSLDNLSHQQNKTYLVFLPYLYTSDQQVIPLNTKKCADLQLNGFDCIDFSQCQDTDIYKTSIPDNCASPSEIDQIINDRGSALHFKLSTSQYNITMQKTEIQFRNQYLNLQGDQFQFTTIRIVKQEITVKQGALFQSSFPDIQRFDRQSFIEKTGLTLIAFYFKFWDRNKIFEDNGIDANTKQVIQEQANRNSNIFQLFSDVIYLKKAIMVLLSSEQLAALNLVGFSAKFYQGIDQNNKQANYIKSENYFENQYLLSQSKDLQYKYVNKFLNRCFKSQNISEVDMRILSSLNRDDK
ncbi:Ras family protein (macronuclear) [Tetrahymena thermophila SB210]|uniref:Ras family protein n=1 Tax=Tetrahymena thermophila (strain SB210) TaxID=312017 RepID=W7X4A0_TETTS|nr:Ras family protein [Tetrahymena thermophila SB210]EWS72257.1 Ras family protein [Tetrahymena thermophila SB210]|eukprot:XP_012655197.1 Ras family protein [Tetrahymena thermophila SB210]